MSGELPEHLGISVRDVVKQYPETRALDGMSLDVRPGEVVTLLGENGAGKSTLMRVLATTILPDSGEVRVGGHDAITDGGAVRRTIGLVLADERSVFWRLDARRNLLFFSALHGLSLSEAKLRADVVLDQVGLGSAGKKMVAKYSTGMRARLLIARALIAEPKVLLFDEPTRSLDPIASASVRQLVVELTREQNLATLYATHDLHEAADIGTRAVLVVAGRVVDSAPAGTDAASLEELFTVQNQQ